MKVGHRGRIVLRSGFWSALAKACTAGNVFLSIPLALSVLDAVEFGLWATMMSVMTLAGFLDLGIGNGAMNLIASAHARGEAQESARTLRVALHVLLLVGAGFAAVVVLCAFLLPMPDIPGIEPDHHGSMWASGIVALVAITIAIPASIGSKALLALGKGDRAFQWQAAGQIAALAGVGAAAHWSPSLPAIMAAASLAPVVASLIATAHALRAAEVRGTPAWPKENHRDVRCRIAGEGALFFCLQVAAALSFSTDLIMISWVSGPEDAGEYGVIQRAFSIAPLLLGLAWAPLWPIYRRSLATGDLPWVAATLRRSLVAAVTVSLMLGMGLLFGIDPILGILSPGLDSPSIVLLTGFAAWIVLEAAGGAMATFLNSASVLRFQLASAAMLVIVCLPTKLYVLSYAGKEWMPWATSAAYVLTFAIPIAVFWRSIWRDVGNRRF